MDLNKIKRLARQAVVSDDFLMETLVLKGGNAIDLMYRVAQRASLDLDFSMSGDFDQETLDGLESRISSQLSRMFDTEDFHVFDVSFSERPSKLPDDLRSMWGGYHIPFMVISNDTLDRLGEDIEALRRNATQLGPGGTSRFSIEISRYEQCEPKTAMDLDGYTIFVYTPTLLVIEKLRAICQQRSDYKTIIYDLSAVTPTENPGFRQPKHLHSASDIPLKNQGIEYKGLGVVQALTGLSTCGTDDNECYQESEQNLPHRS